MTQLKSLVPSEHWRKSEAPHVFPTKASFEWFSRQHRDRLIEAGAYLPRAGRAGSLVDSEKMSAEVMAILTEKAHHEVA